MDDKMTLTDTDGKAENASIMEDAIDADVLAQNQRDFTDGEPTNPTETNDFDQAYVDCIKETGSSSTCA